METMQGSRNGIENHKMMQDADEKHGGQPKFIEMKNWIDVKGKSFISLISCARKTDNMKIIHFIKKTHHAWTILTQEYVHITEV